MKQLQTRHNEHRFTTSNAEEMFGKYTTKRVTKNYTEVVKDSDTGEDMEIERTEILLDRGVIISDDLIASIKFWMAEGSISEVEVSDQLRLAQAKTPSSMFPFKVTVKISGVKDKKETLLLYAHSAFHAIEVVSDYVELNYSGSFFISDIRQLDYCVVLVDKLKDVCEHDTCHEVAYEDNIPEPENTEDSEDEGTEFERDDDEETSDYRGEQLKLKFYQIGAHIETFLDDEPEDDYNEIFIVQTYSATRANQIIEKYLRDCQQKRKMEALKKNPSTLFRELEIRSSIEESKILSINHFVPRYFSDTYGHES